MKNLVSAKVLALAAMSVACLITARADAASIYLKLEGIPGESRVEPGSIELNSFEFDAVALDRQKNIFGTGKGVPSQKGLVESQTIRVTKTIDKATPLLYKAMGDGSVVPSAVLTWGDPHEGDARPRRMKFTNVTISSYSTSSNTETKEDLEAYELTFTKMQMELTFPGPDGTPIILDATTGIPTGKRTHRP